MLDRLLIKICLWAISRRFSRVDIVASRTDTGTSRPQSRWGHMTRVGFIPVYVFYSHADCLRKRSESCEDFVGIELLVQEAEGTPA